MATPRLFRLKAELAPAPSGPVADSLPVAKVRVDTGVFHLDQLFDYSVPEKLSEIINVGIRVQIPFGGRGTEGIIVSRSAKPERAGDLKSITKVISPHPIATQASLELFDACARLYCCNPWDLIRSAIPPRVASVDKELEKITLDKNSVGQQSAPFYQSFSPFLPSLEQMPALINELNIKVSNMIIVTDENDVELLYGQFMASHDNVLKLTSNTSRE